MKLMTFNLSEKRQTRSVYVYQLLQMRVNKVQGIGPKLLINLADRLHLEWGPKFQKLSELISQKFDRLSQIVIPEGYKSNAQIFLLPSVIFVATVFKKAQRAFQQPDFNKKIFLEDIKFKSKQIISKGNVTAEAADRFVECVACCFMDVAYIFDLYSKHQKYIYELINTICEKKVKGLESIDIYKAEQITKIANHFKEKIYLLNYDVNKNALENIPIDYDSMYILKAKDMYFLLFKLQEITLTSSSKVSHEELAYIFNIGYKLQNQSPDKKTKTSPEKSQLQKSTIKTQKSVIQIQSKTNQPLQESKISVDSPKKQANKFAVCKLKSSHLFPQEVKCKNCCRIISQFNALYWNYASYCLQCVVNPKVDITFVPSNLIRKFLKNMHYDNNSPYEVVCPQCQAHGAIKNYKVDDKPKEYECLTCKKTICIEHQRMIIECFCYCIYCKKATITIESLFQKYCPSCKKRLCQLCNLKGTTQCACLCKNCGEPNLADHVCKGRCHSCKASDLWLMQCPCNLKLCSMCFYKRFQPSEQTCEKAR